MDKGKLGKRGREEAYTVWGTMGPLRKERGRAKGLRTQHILCKASWDRPEKHVWVRNKHASAMSLEGLWFCSCVRWEEAPEVGYDWIVLFGLVIEDRQGPG